MPGGSDAGIPGSGRRYEENASVMQRRFQQEYLRTFGPVHKVLAISGHCNDYSQISGIPRYRSVGASRRRCDQCAGAVCKSAALDAAYDHNTTGFISGFDSNVADGCGLFLQNIAALLEKCNWTVREKKMKDYIQYIITKRDAGVDAVLEQAPELSETLLEYLDLRNADAIFVIQQNR